VPSVVGNDKCPTCTKEIEPYESALIEILTRQQALQISFTQKPQKLK
jgi:hypothetical protein